MPLGKKPSLFLCAAQTLTQLLFIATDRQNDGIGQILAADAVLNAKPKRTTRTRKRGTVLCKS